MGNTVLARVGHIVSGGNASLTGRIAYGQDWGRRLFPFQGLFSIHGQRRGVVFLVFKPESERGHDPESTIWRDPYRYSIGLVSYFGDA